MHKILLFLCISFLGFSILHAQSQPDSLPSFLIKKSVLQQDLFRVLSGVQPGLRITSSGGLSGSGTNAVIRGFSSLNAGSDPLIIVDGIRLDGRNNQNNSAFTGGGTLTTPNRIIDINPSEIVNVQVLNSLSATIRYGEEARNGVILISTERVENNLPTNQLELSYQQGFYRTQISSRPDYQNKFGMGFNGGHALTYSSWGPAFNSADESSFGSYFAGFDQDGTILIAHPLTSNSLTAAAFPELANETYRFESKPTPTTEFFNNSLSTSSLIGAKFRSGDYFLNINYAGNWEDGFTPNNTFKRNNIGASFSYPIMNKVSGNSTLQFAFTDIKSPTLSAGGGSGRDQIDAGPSVFSDLFYTPRSLGFDMQYQNPLTGGSAYYRLGNDILNPRWTVDNTEAKNNANRIYGKTEVLIDASEQFRVIYKYAFESYDENQEYGLNPSLVNNYPFQTGLYQTIDFKRTHYEQHLLFQYFQDVGEHLRLDVDFGLSYFSESVKEYGLESTDIGELGVFKHENFGTQIPINSFTNNLFGRDYERRTFSVFSIAKLDYQNLIFTELGLRGEYNNSLQQQDLNAWYPAINLGYVPTNHFEGSMGILSYAKIEVGYFTTGRGLLTEQEILVQDRTSVGVNKSIKPERSSEKQASVELGFLDNRVTLKSTYYQRVHTNLISRIAVNSDPSISSILDNLMEVESEGFEMSLNAIPFQQIMQWSILAVFSTNDSKVREYTGLFNAVQLGNSLPSRGNVAIIDKAFMSMYGTKIIKVDQELTEVNPNFTNVPVGTPIVDYDGNYITGEVGIIGNPVPKWNASMIHQFEYRNVGLSIQFDYQRGGDMYSTWISSLLGRGVVDVTTEMDRTKTYVIEGVKLDGSKNDIELSSQQYYFNNIGFGPDQARVYDMTHFRISHIGIDFQIPQKKLQKTRIKEVNISLSVENAFLYMPNIPKGLGFDPNVNSNGSGVNNMGFEYLTGPGVRRIGGAVRLKF